MGDSRKAGYEADEELYQQRRLERFERIDDAFKLQHVTNAYEAITHFMTTNPSLTKLQWVRVETVKNALESLLK